MNYGVTGPRDLTELQMADVYRCLPGGGLNSFHVGDARGLDWVARQRWEEQGWHVTVYRTEGPQRWQLQARSKRMVEALAELGGKLYAYPNKPEPAGITRDRWQGSGTWGTINYAELLGVPVVIVPVLVGVVIRAKTVATAPPQRVEQLSMW